MSSFSAQRRMLFLAVIAVVIMSAAIFAKARTNGDLPVDAAADYGLDPAKVTVIHEAASPEFRPPPPGAADQARRRYGLPDRLAGRLGVPVYSLPDRTRPVHDVRGLLALAGELTGR